MRTVKVSSYTYGNIYVVPPQDNCTHGTIQPLSCFDVKCQGQRSEFQLYPLIRNGYSHRTFRYTDIQDDDTLNIYDLMSKVEKCAVATQGQTW